MSGALRGILIGCGGLSILGVVLGIGAIVLIAGSSGTDEGGDEAAAPVNIGEPIAVGEAEWVVTNARKVSELSSSFGTSRQGNFVVVDFTLRNDGSEQVTLSEGDIKLVDDQDRTFETDSDLWEFVEGERNVFLEAVNPGVTEEGEAIYEIPDDAANFQAEVAELGSFTGEPGRVNLGL